MWIRPESAPDKHGTEFSRRTLIRTGAWGLAGLSLPGWLERQARGEVTAGKAKSVIQLWMGGGPTHLDTFDPKPEAGEDYCGPYRRPVETNVKGIRLGQKLPLLAKHAEKFSIIRSMTHPSNAHETATYIMQTGTPVSGELVYPSVGAVAALKKGYEAGYRGVLPPYISIPRALGRFNEAGFLGTDYRPFVTGGDPNAKNFRVGGIVPPPGMNEARLRKRRTLLESLDQLAREIEHSESFDRLDTYQKKTYELILGEAKKAFDLSQEPDAVRDRFGRNTFGQSCLLARRLVENGVPFVTVVSGGWDTHKNNFEQMGKLLPVLDRGFAALLEDLAQRGLLESTIVVWAGEFGRTPKVQKDPPWNGGRHHFSRCFSAVVAGGGFQGGQVVGASDRRGETVRDRPVYPWDISASMYQLLGIDPKGELPHPHGCVAYVTPPASGSAPGGGMLKEIM